MAQEWLIGAQLPEGNWLSHPGGERGLPISTTTRVLTALKSTGVPSDHPAISRGESFLLGRQEPPGVWSERSGKWQTHLTAQVVEYFNAKAIRQVSLNAYLKSARALLIKSEQLTFSEDPFDSSLAVASAYHGVEHFLYGLLLELDSTESIFLDRGSTIGLNSALGILERTLQAGGQLLPTARLPYRQQLQHLSTKRDMFIHRAESISLADAQNFIATCRSFVQRFDLDLLGYRLAD
jgi:hypothetical protein